MIHTYACNFEISDITSSNFALALPLKQFEIHCGLNSKLCHVCIRRFVSCKAQSCYVKRFQLPADWLRANEIDSGLVGIELDLNGWAHTTSQSKEMRIEEKIE